MAVTVKDLRFSIYLNNDQARKSAIEMQSQLQRVGDEMAQLAKDGKKETAEYRDKKKELDGLKEKYSSLKKEAGLYGMSMKELQKLSRTLKADMDRMIPNSKEWKAADRDLKAVNNRMKEVRDTAKSTQGSLSKFNGSGGILANMTSGFGKMFAGIAVGAAVFSFFKSAAVNAMEFSKAVSELSAITGASGDDLDYLKTKAKELGAQYGLSATQIVTAMKLVGSAKPELLDNVQALSQVTEGVLTLSKASGMELGDTTKSLTTIMNQFGLSAVETDRAINVLAAGSKYGAVEVDYLGEAIVKVGTVAKSAGLSIETTTAAMELFGEKGIRAEIAGTGFKSVLVELQKDTKNYTNGVFDLNKAIDNNQSIAGNNIALTEKFGKEYFNLAQILFQNKERFKELGEQVTGTNTAMEQYLIATDNLSGDIDKLTSSWDAFMLSLEDGQGPIANTFRRLIQFAKEAVNGLEALTTSGEQKKQKSQDRFVSQRIDTLTKDVGSEKDKVGYINSVINAENNLNKKRREEINKLNNDLIENEKKNFFMYSTQMKATKTKRIEELKKEIANSIAFSQAANELGASFVKPTTTTTDTTETEEQKKEREKAEKEREKAEKKAQAEKDKLKSENKQTNKELADSAIADLQRVIDFSAYSDREQFAGKKRTIEQEHELRLKQLEEDESLELKRADLSDQSVTQIEKEKNLIRQKYRALNAEENAAYTDQVNADEKATELKYLNDRLSAEIDNLKVSYDIKKQLRIEAMKDELKLVKKGSKEEKAIRDKYRKMDESADAELFQSKQEKIFEYAKAGQAIFSELNNFLSALGDRELAKFEKDNKGKANFDEEYAKKKAEIEIKAAKRAKLMGAFSTIINTAAAVLGALAPPPVGAGPILGIPFAIAAGVQGALQLGTILAAPIPEGFRSGGYTGDGRDDEPAGTVHRGEFVANAKAVRNPHVRKFLDVFNQAQMNGGIRMLNTTQILQRVQSAPAQGYQSGGYVAPTKTPAGVDVTTEVLRQNTDVMRRLNNHIENGIPAYSVISGRNGSAEMTKKYEKYISNASRT